MDALAHDLWSDRWPAVLSRACLALVCTACLKITQTVLGSEDLSRSHTVCLEMNVCPMSCIASSAVFWGSVCMRPDYHVHERSTIVCRVLQFLCRSTRKLLWPESLSQYPTVCLEVRQPVLTLDFPDTLSHVESCLASLVLQSCVWRLLGIWASILKKTPKFWDHLEFRICVQKLTCIRASQWTFRVVSCQDTYMHELHIQQTKCWGFMHNSGCKT